MSDSRLDKGLGKTSLALVWNKMKAYVNSFMGTIDAKLNALSVDYVVEQNSNDNGTYRKWNSGLLECWGSATIATNGVAGYIEPAHPFIDTTFSVFPSFTYISALTGVTLSYCHQCVPGSSTFHIYARTSTGALPNVEVPLKYYAYGKWK